MRSAALLCVLAASLDTAAAYQLTSRGGSRRDVLKAFVATAPLFAAANSASAGTVGAAPVSDRLRTWDPPIYHQLIPRLHRARQTPEDEAKFDVIFAQKLEEKKVMFAKMGYEVEEEDKKEVRPCTAMHRCHPRTTTGPCLHVLGLDDRRARCVRVAARVPAADEPVRLPGQAQVQGVGQTAQVQVEPLLIGVGACLSIMLCVLHAFNNTCTRFSLARSSPVSRTKKGPRNRPRGERVRVDKIVRVQREGERDDTFFLKLCYAMYT